MAPERFVDLLDRGGLDAVSTEEQAHLQECDACRDNWATVAAAGEVLTEARPKQEGRVVRMVPLIAAAAILLTIVGVIVAHKGAPAETKLKQDPLTLFLQGTSEESKGARAALLKAGRGALPGLVAARPKLKGSARFQELQNLIWAIKRDAAQDAAASAILNKLETIKMDLQFEQSRLDDILAFMRNLSGQNLVLDPTVDGGMVDLLSLKDATLRSVLETVCAVKDLDFDVKYGVTFLSRPMRLWSTDPALGLPAANLWKSGPAASGDAVLGNKLRSVRVTLDMENAPLSAVAQFLREISALPIAPSPGIAENKITLKFEGLPMEHALELMTLPFGWDVRIDDGSVVLFAPKK
jgi:hypothetical protein